MFESMPLQASDALPLEAPALNDSRPVCAPRHWRRTRHVEQRARPWTEPERRDARRDLERGLPLSEPVRATAALPRFLTCTCDGELCLSTWMSRKSTSDGDTVMPELPEPLP